MKGGEDVQPQRHASSKLCPALFDLISAVMDIEVTSNDVPQCAVVHQHLFGEADMISQEAIPLSLTGAEIDADK